MIAYWADNMVPIGLWEEKATVHFGNSQIEINFVYEAPFGDFIYEVLIGEEKTVFSKWIYGRNMIFFDEKFALLETVEKNSSGPIKTALLNIDTKQWVTFDKWYDKCTFIGRSVHLKSSFTDATLTIDSVNDLNFRET